MNLLFYFWQQLFEKIFNSFYSAFIQQRAYQKTDTCDRDQKHSTPEIYRKHKDRKNQPNPDAHKSPFVPQKKISEFFPVHINTPFRISLGGLWAYPTY
jgi:hypothetical protein